MIRPPFDLSIALGGEPVYLGNRSILTFPAFVEIDQVRNCENVGSIGDAVLLFSFLQHGSERIAPPDFRHEPIPDKEVIIIRLPAALKTPLKDFLVSSTLKNALAKIVIVDPQKIAASTIKRSGRAKILVIILVQFAPIMQPNFVQHAWEIHHPARHFFRASGVSRHSRLIGVSPCLRNRCD
jgi:hypothetical protein